jgi:hypothetical protein
MTDTKDSQYFMIAYKAFGQDHRQGPYSAADVDSHLSDIAGYEGITDARKIPVEAPDAFTVAASPNGVAA